MKTSKDLTKKLLNITVVVASLGYFIDMFDFFLFNVLRVKSLTGLGLSGADLTHAGLFISNCQMAGVLAGAYLSGIVGDKWGRKTSLFLSIIVYSLGSLGSAAVTTVPLYGLARFIVGAGIAGELGSGIVIISEKLRGDRRGFGVMLFLVMGFCGVLTAAMVAEIFPWRIAYLICGGAGLLLLFTRALLSESGLFEELRERDDVPRGGLRLIFRNPTLLKNYLASIVMILPGVFAPQILWTLAPEVGRAAGIADPVKASIAVMLGFVCGIISDFLSVVLSEKLRSRKRATFVFIALAAACFAHYMFWPAHNLRGFYIANALMGTGLGVWVIGMVWTAEGVGTNVRATVVTTVPNFARGLVIIMNLIYGHLTHSMTALNAVGLIGIGIFTLSFLGWCARPETYGRDLDFVEEAT